MITPNEIIYGLCLFMAILWTIVPFVVFRMKDQMNEIITLLKVTEKGND